MSHRSGTGAATLAREQALIDSLQSNYNTRIKRLLDLGLAVPLAVLLSPVFAVVSAAIIVDSGLPVLYRGERAGLGGHAFRIMKFRTMIPEAEAVGGGTTALKDPRITKVGAFLRKTKIDEFPQLLNVIRGEMSFVGPRPELLQYTSEYSGLERYIVRVRPGITDFSSIEFINLDEVVGENDADGAYERHVLRRKNALRIKYVEELSARTDLRLFMTTVGRTLGKFSRQLVRGGERDGVH